MRRGIERGVLGLAAIALVACVNEPDTRAHGEQIATVTAPTLGPAGTLELRDPAVAGLSDASRAALAQAPFRMLVLPEEYAAGSTVLSDAHWSAVSFRGDGLSISIHATNVWHDGATPEDLAALPQPTASVHGHPAWQTENEAIQSVSWNEHDVSFALEVECDDPEGDARCADGAFVEALADRLVYAQAEVQR